MDGNANNVRIIIEAVQKGREAFDQALKDIQRVTGAVEQHGRAHGAAQKAIHATGEAMLEIGRAAKELVATLLELAAPLLAIAGIFEGFELVKSFFELGNASQQAAIRLEFLTGSSRKAREELERLHLLSTETPFSVENLERAERLLAGTTVGVIDLGKALHIASDAAVATGQDITTTAEEVNRIIASIRQGTDLSFLRSGGNTGLLSQTDIETLRRMKDAGADVNKQLDFAIERMKRFEGATELQQKTFGGLAGTIRAVVDALKVQFIDPILEKLIPALAAVGQKLKAILESEAVKGFAENVVLTVELIGEKLASGDAGKILGLLLRAGIEEASEFLKSAFEASLKGVALLMRSLWSTEFAVHAISAIKDVGTLLAETFTRTVAVLTAGLIVAGSTFANKFAEFFESGLAQLASKYPNLKAIIQGTQGAVKGVQNAVTAIGAQYLLGASGEDISNFKAQNAEDERQQALNQTQKVGQATITYADALKSVQAKLESTTNLLKEQVSVQSELLLRKRLIADAADELAKSEELALEHEKSAKQLLKETLEERRREKELNSPDAAYLAQLERIHDSAPRPPGRPPANYTFTTGTALKDAFAGTPAAPGFVDSLGNAATRASAILKGTLGNAINGVSTGITGLITGTLSWGQAMRQTAIAVIGALVQIGVEYVAQSIFRRIIATTETAHETAQVGARVAAHTAGEGAKTGSTFFGSIARGAIRVGETIFHGIQVGIRVAAHVAGEIAKTTVTIAQAAIRIATTLLESGKELILAAIKGAAAVADIPFAGPVLAIAAIAAILAAGAKAMGAFDEGGYTGDGGRRQVAGYVHKGEVVIPAPTVQRYGVDHFAATYFNGRMPGYVGGGYVRPFTPINGAQAANAPRGSTAVGVTIIDGRDRNEMRDALARDTAAIVIDELNRRGKFSRA